MQKLNLYQKFCNVLFSYLVIVITNSDTSVQVSKESSYLLRRPQTFQKILHFGFERLEYLIQFEIGGDQYVCVNLITPSVILFELNLCGNSSLSNPKGAIF